MIEIETSKGRFLVCNDDCDEFESLLYFFREYKLSEITEEEASSIVDETFNAYNEHSFVYYGYYVFSGCCIITATQSLHSLLESQGIETTQNTYIFKI